MGVYPLCILFNAARMSVFILYVFCLLQQECRCGSSECRGVIGGKRTLNTGKQADKVPDDYKDKRKSKCMNKKLKDKVCAIGLIGHMAPTVFNSDITGNQLLTPL